MKKDTPRKTVKVKLKEGQKDQTEIARSNRSRSLERSATACPPKLFLFRLISTYLSEGGSIRAYPILGAFGNNPGEQ
jgi:hypothetical protein